MTRLNPLTSRAFAWALIAVGALIVAGSLLFARPNESGAARTCNLGRVFNQYGQGNYNYDFTSTSLTARGPVQTGDVCLAPNGLVTTNVDWADNMLFYDSAYTTDVARNILGWGCAGGLPCDPEHGWSSNSLPGGAFDNAEGVKDHAVTAACNDISAHIRVHGVPGGSGRVAGASGFQVNPMFGYYVWATTHFDHNEGSTGGLVCPDEFFGSQELSESFIAGKLQGKPRVLRTFPNCCNLGNYEIPRRDAADGKHRWDSDGAATYIHVLP